MKQLSIMIMLGASSIFFNYHASEPIAKNKFEESKQILAEIAACKDWKGCEGLSRQEWDQMSCERNKEYWEKVHKYLNDNNKISCQRKDILVNLNDSSFNVNQGIVFNSPCYRNDWPLHWAVKMQDIELIKVLMNRGANPYATSCLGETPEGILKDFDYIKGVMPAVKEKIRELLFPAR
jgi:hypothetical protein